MLFPPKSFLALTILAALTLAPAAHAFPLICSGSVNGKSVTLTIPDAKTVQITGFGAPRTFKDLESDDLNSTELLSQFKTDDNGGLTLVIQKVGKIPADISVEAKKLGSFDLPDCNF
jgi:hypothetical protein